MRTEKMKTLVAEGTAPASFDQVEIAPDERNRWLTAAYRESSIPDRPRNMIGMLKDLPPAEMEAMYVASTKIDDEALRALANERARAVKDALVTKGVTDDRLFLLAPRLGGSASGAPTTTAQTRVDLALR